MTLILSTFISLLETLALLSIGLSMLLILIPGGPGHIPVKRFLESHKRGMAAYRAAFRAYKGRHYHEYMIERTREVDRREVRQRLNVPGISAEEAADSLSRFGRVLRLIEEGR